MRIFFVMVLMAIFFQSCLVKDKTVEKQLTFDNVYLQRVVPGAEEEKPHYRIVFELSNKSIITSIDSALYNKEMLSIQVNSSYEYQIKVKDNRKHLPFKVFYNIKGKKYFSYILEMKEIESDYRP